jgi:hypothetical protein
MNADIHTTTRRLARRLARRLVRSQDERAHAWRLLTLARWAHESPDQMIGPLVDTGLRPIAVAIVALGQAIESEASRLIEERKQQEQ